MHLEEELIKAARGKAKAMIGLPPRLHDTDGTIVWVVGTRELFEDQPIEFDRIISTDTLVQNLPVPSQQTTGVVDDQIVIKVEIPELPDLPENVLKLDEINDKLSQLTLVGALTFPSVIKRLVKNQILLEFQKVRLARAESVLLKLGATDRARFRAFVRTDTASRKITKRTAKGARLVTKAKSPLRVAGRVILKGVLKVLFFVGFVVDVILVVHRTVKGAQKDGVPGAVGGFVAGVADAVTIGLLPKTTSEKIESSIVNFTKAIGGSLGKIGAQPDTIAFSAG